MSFSWLEGAYSQQTMAFFDYAVTECGIIEVVILNTSYGILNNFH